MNRLLVIVMLVLTGFSFLRADDAAAVASPVTDPAQVSKHYHEVLTRPQFEETDRSTINSRVEEWLSDWFRELGAEFGEFKYTSHMPAFESLLMTLLVVFCIAILLYIMVRLTRRRDGLDSDSPDTTPGQKNYRPPEFYEEEIRQAIAARDWHTAWLAAWRQFLSRLENRHLVDADRTRTNREYLAQLQEKSLPGSALTLLAGMVSAYDQFIYGRKPIGEPDWNFFHQQLSETTLLLHLDSKSPKQTGSAS